MLTSLLPGLREVRTPLAAGYLWLVALWLIFSEEIPKSEAQAPPGILHSAFELGGFLGAGAILAALTFVAYLLGVMIFMRIPWNIFVFKKRVGLVGVGNIGEGIPIFVSINRIWARVLLIPFRETRRYLESQVTDIVHERISEPKPVITLDEHRAVFHRYCA